MKFFGILSFFTASVLIASAAPTKYHVRQPHPGSYEVEDAQAKGKTGWIEARSENGITVEVGDRVAIQVQDERVLAKVLRGKGLKKARKVTDQIFILQAPDALTAMKEAEELSALPEVSACYPVVRQAAELNAPFAPLPNDIFFHRFLTTSGTNGIWGQWNLENRTFAGVQMGPDINIRAAWRYAQGTGITVAVADTGIETTHPDLVRNTLGAPHFNFSTGTTNVIPSFPIGQSEAFWAHGTQVGGIIGATANNNRGIAGIAFESKLASWVVFGTNRLLVGEEQLMDMYQFNSNSVSIQNHSWEKTATTRIQPLGPLERVGLSNAVYHGRNGLGSIIVRSAGNFGSDRFMSPDERGENANRETITVAATRYNGRVAIQSERGACVLLAAPAGDPGSPQFFTTDLAGIRGTTYPVGYGGDLGDYSYPGGLVGTSASAAQVSGISALILSANTNLPLRDVQQILIHSARHFDFADPDVITNAAGFIVSHNIGYGIPDAGEAVRLAKIWQNRPALTNVAVLSTDPAVIPDAGLRVVVTGDNVPANLLSIPAAPSRGPHPDSPTPSLPLIDVGSANGTIFQDLTNKGALILRDSTAFATKINFAAQAGASFAIIYNSSLNPIVAMAQTEFVTIPAVGIPKAEGEALRDFISTNSTAQVRLELNSATYNFSVPESLSCEHVGLRIKSNHPQRGDLRITLTSPRGTRSVFQQLNQDTQPYPSAWTYFSTHHFYENSAGTWTAAITDEFPGGTGSVEELELFVWGTTLDDSDRDGLEDSWETAQFGTLATNPQDDPDKDGYNNIREKILATNPLQPNAPLIIDLWPLNDSYFRASWPSSLQFDYEVWAGTNVTALNLLTNIVGRFPDTDCIFAATNSAQFVRVVQKTK